MTRKDDQRPPTSDPVILEVSLYPRSAQALLDMLESNPYPPGLPLYAAVDLDNLRNQLRAHLQRVARGE